jgi:hypothetical protein
MSVTWRGVSLQVAISVTVAAMPLQAVMAQAYPPPPPDYQATADEPYDGPDSYAQPGPQDGYPDLPPPPGYDGSQPPPPPPGFQPDPAYASDPDQDRRYEAYAEDWAQRYCVKARSKTGTGAVIGGLLGALVGSGLSGRHDQGAGALVGGLAGAAGGAAIGSTTANETSPGCPPGFVVRGDAPAFAYQAYGTPYYYAAPGWYQPWVFVENRWTYRPYPYYGWYYGHYHGGRPGFYGRPGYGWRGGYHGGGRWRR